MAEKTVPKVTISSPEKDLEMARSIKVESDNDLLDLEKEEGVSSDDSEISDQEKDVKFDADTIEKIDELREKEGSISLRRRRNLTGEEYPENIRTAATLARLENNYPDTANSAARKSFIDLSPITFSNLNKELDPKSKWWFNLIYPELLLGASLIRIDIISFLYFAGYIVHKLGYLKQNIRNIVSRILFALSLIVMIIRIPVEVYMYFTGVSSQLLLICGFKAINTVGTGIILFLPEALVAIVTATAVFVVKDFNVLALDEKEQTPMAKSKALNRLKIFNACLMTGFLIFTFLSSFLYLNIISMIYITYLLIEIILYGVQSDDHSAVLTLRKFFRIIIFVFNVGHLLILYVFQSLSVYVTSESRELFGFVSIMDTFSYYHVYLLTLLAMFFCSATSSGLVLRENLLSETTSRVRLISFDRNFGIKNLFSGLNGDYLSQYDAIRFKSLVYYLIRNGPRIASGLMITLALCFPSFPAVILLIWGSITIVSPKSLFKKTGLGVICYSSIICLLEASFQISKINSLHGLHSQNDNYFLIGLFIILIYIFTLVSCFSQLTTNPETNSEQSQPTKISHSMFFILIYFWKNVYLFALKYVYVISLLFIYYFSLQKVNVTNAVYNLYFLLFLIFPRIASVGWNSLVIYTLFTIMLQYLYHILPLTGGLDTYLILFGLNISSRVSLWTSVQYNIVILAFTVLQMSMYDYVRKNEIERRFHIDTKPKRKREFSVNSLPVVLRVNSFLKSVSRIVLYLIRSHTLTVTQLMFSVWVLLKISPTVFDMGYFLLFGIYLAASELNKSVKLIWLIFTLYPSLVVSSCYLYQFPVIQSVLINSLGISESLLAFVGLERKEGILLFQYLLQHLTLVLLCVIQARVYFGSFNTRSSVNFRDFRVLKVLNSIFKHVAIISIFKVVLLLIFIVGVQLNSTLGLAVIVYLLFIKALLNIRNNLIDIVFMTLLIFLNESLRAFLTFNNSNRLTNFVEAYLVSDRNYGPVKYSTFSCLYIFLFNIFTRNWDKHLKSTYPIYSEVKSESEYPLVGLETVFQHQTDFHDSLIMFVIYWGSNLFNHFGFEVCMFVMYFTCTLKMNGISLFYLTTIGFYFYVNIIGLFLYSGKLQKSEKGWLIFSVALPSLLIVIQYLFFIGLPFVEREKWLHLNQTTLSVLGLGESSTSILIADFFVFLLCLLYYKSIYQDKSLPYAEEPSQISNFRLIFKKYFFNYSINDFTLNKTYNIVSNLRFLLIRYFIWFTKILCFATGTIDVNLLSLIFLIFSLFLIYKGESILVKPRKKRIKIISYLSLYLVLYLALLTCYQLTKIIRNYGGDIISKQIGLTYFEQADDKGTLFTGALLFLATLLQVKLFKSNSLYFVSKFIKRDSRNALLRARDYQLKRQKAVLERNDSFKKEITVLREHVVVRKSFQRDIQDWISIIGKNPENDSRFLVINKTGPSFGDVTMAMEEREDDINLLKTSQVSISRRNSKISANTFTLKRQTLRKRLNILSPIKRRGSTDFDDKTLHFEYEKESIDQQDIFDKEELLKRFSLPYYLKLLDYFITKLLEFSVKFNDLYSTDSQENLANRLKDNFKSRLLAITKGLSMLVFAHTILISYFLVFINQIIHANVLSTVLILSVLLIGMVSRPYPSRKFWNFMIIFTIFTIVIKYFFQFEFFTFNETKSQSITEKLQNPVVIIGIEKADNGSFFSNVVTELLMLLSFVAHRAVMKRLGLWKYLEELEKYTEGIEETEALDEKTSKIIQKQEYQKGEFIRSEPLATVYIPHDMSNLTDLKEIWNRETQKGNLIFSVFSLFNTMIYSLRLASGVIHEDSKTHELNHGTDFYVGYFFADIIVFFLTIVFWTSFSGDFGNTYNSDSNLQFLSQVIIQNTVPPFFAAILILNFTLILIDRAIYTSKSILAKVVLHYLTVISFTAWIYFALPISNNDSFTNLHSLQLWFFFKCVYWYLSGLQIKSGFPQYRFENLFNRSYSFIARILFLLYRAIPFVWEFRAFVDWTLTDTSFDLYSWLKFEDISANLYLVKAARESMKNEDRYFGLVQKRFYKQLLGSFLILTLVGLLWFPIILLSIPGTTTQNPILQAQVDVSFEGYLPLYQQQLSASNIVNFTSNEFNAIKQEYKYLIPSYFSASVLQEFTFDQNSMSFWAISPTSRNLLLSSLKKNDTPVRLSLQWSFQRTITTVPLTVSGQKSIDLDTDTRLAFYNALTNNNGSSRTVGNSSFIFLPFAYPTFLHAFPNGPIQNLAPDYLLQFTKNMSLTFTNNATSDLNESNNPSLNIGWWQVWDGDKVNSNNSIPSVNNTNVKGLGMSFYVLSDNVPAISQLSSYGIIGLYIAVVLTAGRFIRLTITDLTLRIIYEDLPCPDFVLQICSDCVLARDYETEETLYWLLITLFRNPAALMEMTRVEDEEDEENDTQPTSPLLNNLSRSSTLPRRL